MRGRGTLACFDLDGVLLDTEPMKLTAWRETVNDVLAPSPSELDELDRYNRAHRGVPRAVKFQHVVEIFHATSTALDRLLETYARRLDAEAATLRPASGALEFVRAWSGPTAIVSSAPQAEVERNADSAGFRRIDEIFGYPTAKVDALRTLAAEYGRPIFFGDAAADREAAAEAQVAFVAIGQGIGNAATDITSAADLGVLIPDIQRLARLA